MFIHLPAVHSPETKKSLSGWKGILKAAELFIPARI
jgi:hypothetical protein